MGILNTIGTGRTEKNGCPARRGAPSLLKQQRLLQASLCESVVATRTAPVEGPPARAPRRLC
eukprot:9727520-Alexandrium_andersonii.AAC.1